MTARIKIITPFQWSINKEQAHKNKTGTIGSSNIKRSNKGEIHKTQKKTAQLLSQLSQPDELCLGAIRTRSKAHRVYSVSSRWSMWIGDSISQLF
jgi:hypothetical protein